MKGKGAALPDFDSDLPIPTTEPAADRAAAQQPDGICWEGSFAAPKKNLADQFNAKQP